MDNDYKKVYKKPNVKKYGNIKVITKKRGDYYDGLEDAS